MIHRRDFLVRALQGSSLLAASAVVPEFVVNTARAAEAGKDSVLVLVELTGGNDGLNTVIPYADDTYHKARPTLRFTKQQVVREVLNSGDAFGSQAAGGERVLVEFVSANPTGPLHVGHGRQAALGDAICNLLATQGLTQRFAVVRVAFTHYDFIHSVAAFENVSWHVAALRF